MADVNGLKLVNDTLGHLYGDKLLISFSKILLESKGIRM
ncbi:diguanylate cyclase domain-containing protein [Caloramator sp. Dgby_cultured_2]|nr:diguanylate cyclase [Caloramator sp. Dgby_cultured_2]WDU82777.1 diguanylate cyclase [Caloramator sp. Dgby_cultured_2]